VKWRRRHIIFLLALLFIGFNAPELTSQSASSDEIINDSKREEVQRYFGYELLLYRYLSLPYDVSVNVNQQGNFVDIGVLYILFFPLLIVVFLSRKRWGQLLAIGYLLFTWVIATSNAFVFSVSQGNIPGTRASIASYLSSVRFVDEPFGKMAAWLYQLSLFIYQPFERFGNMVSGDSDHITYPVIFSGFVLLSLLIAHLTQRRKPKVKGFIAFFWAYSFYWFAFSGGIIWYGYILLLMGVLVIPFLIGKLEERGFTQAARVQKLFVICGVLWLFFALAYRTSDIQPMMDKKFFAKGLFNPVYYDYAAGKIDEETSLDLIYPGVTKAFAKVNSDNAYILRVGTSFNYFLKNNHKRVIMDNQLSLFHRLHTRYPDNLTKVDVLKASGIKYIFLDLNTASIDYTPDKSLTSKYSEILRFVVNNPYLKMLSTDRVVGNRNTNGQMIYTRNIYGEEIHQFGRYAIFEIK